MREIKFRAWVESQKYMHHFGLEGTTMRETPIMQFTGLKDKNGREIYEGDIVINAWHNIYQKPIGKTWVVKFGEYDNSDIEYGSGGLGFYCETKDGEQECPINIPLDDKEKLEVIGNIHENQELLK